MHNSEFEKLVRALTAVAQMPDLTRGNANMETLATVERTRAWQDAGVVGRESDHSTTVEHLLLASLPPRQTQIAPVPPVGASAAETAGSSTAMNALKTIGMVMGVGPVVTGLLKIFGGSNNSEQSFAPIPFQLPESIALEAGLASDRTIAPVGYSQQGTPRDTRVPVGQAPIQINVQAMDSRSFLDHRDEIAHAVREAMLQSHSLNDVMAEI